MHLQAYSPPHRVGSAKLRPLKHYPPLGFASQAAAPIALDKGNEKYEVSTSLKFNGII
jgi:hypothetical protein